MKSRRAKSLIFTSIVFSTILVGLAFTPHYTCGCGQYEDGSQLTNIINTTSEKTFGVTLIEKKTSPFK